MATFTAHEEAEHWAELCLHYMNRLTALQLGLHTESDLTRSDGKEQLNGNEENGREKRGEENGNARRRVVFRNGLEQEEG